MVAVLGEDWRDGLDKARKIKVREAHECEFGVVALSRNVVGPLAHGLAVPAGARAPDDDSDSKHDSPSIRSRKMGSATLFVLPSRGLLVRKIIRKKSACLADDCLQLQILATNVG